MPAFCLAMPTFLLLLLLLALRASYIVAEAGELTQPLAGDLSLQERDTPSQSYLEDRDGVLNNVTDWEIIPHAGLEKQFFNSSRRRLGSFQVCALCTCCGGRRRFCIPTACCYSITCGSPNRPFGFCSFKPMSCNCFSCRL